MPLHLRELGITEKGGGIKKARVTRGSAAGANWEEIRAKK